MKDLKLGIQMGYWGAQPPEDIIGIAKEAENLGYDAIWSAESWGSDVFTPLAWIGAHTSKIKLGTGIAQISARTPAATAMAAITLDHLTKGRVGLAWESLDRKWLKVGTVSPFLNRYQELENTSVLLKKF